MQALESPPLLINISKQYTLQALVSELYADALEVMTWPGILSAGVAMGFYHAAVEEMGASFMAVADQDRELAGKAARWMAERAWSRRQELRILVPPAEAVRRTAQAAVLPRCAFRNISTATRCIMQPLEITDQD